MRGAGPPGRKAGSAGSSRGAPPPGRPRAHAGEPKATRHDRTRKHPGQIPRVLSAPGPHPPETEWPVDVRSADVRLVVGSSVVGPFGRAGRRSGVEVHVVVVPPHVDLVLLDLGGQRVRVVVLVRAR